MLHYLFDLFARFVTKFKSVYNLICVNLQTETHYY